MKQKIYFHYKLLFPILFFGSSAAFFGLRVFHGSDSFMDWGVLLCSMAFVLMAMYGLWARRKDEVLEVPRHSNVIIHFQGTEILFPNGYFFKHSSIRRSKKIQREMMREVNLNHFPLSLVINDNEVIFIPQKYRKELEHFARIHQLPLVNRFDIWEAINEEFLDTEFDKAHLEATLSALEKNGVSRTETAAIRKRIRFSMLSGNAIVWEWMHLGHFDYLNWSMVSKRKYWWSMEIALRNYQAKV